VQWLPIWKHFSRWELEFSKVDIFGDTLLLTRLPEGTNSDRRKNCMGYLFGSLSEYWEIIAWPCWPAKITESSAWWLPAKVVLWANTLASARSAWPSEGLGFNSRHAGIICHAGLCACFEINFSSRQEGSAVSSIICDRWLIMSWDTR